MGDTADRIRELLAGNPNLRPTEVARLLGISRQRVHEVATDNGIVFVWRTAIPKPRVLTGGVAVRVSQTVTGTIGELMAAADLAARGYTVFFPFVRTGACDLVIVSKDGHTIERIEVRCGKRSLNGKRLVFSTQGDRAKCDRYAVVLTGEPVAYVPPFNDPE